MICYEGNMFPFRLYSGFQVVIKCSIATQNFTIQNLMSKKVFFLQCFRNRGAYEKTFRPDSIFCLSKHHILCCVPSHIVRVFFRIVFSQRKSISLHFSSSKVPLCIFKRRIHSHRLHSERESRAASTMVVMK